MTKDEFLENHRLEDCIEYDEDPRCDYCERDIRDEDYVYVFQDDIGRLWCICERCAVRAVSGAEMIEYMENNEYLGKMKYPEYVEMKGCN